MLLGLSLALNLAVLGLVAGALIRFGGPDGMHRPPRSLGAALYRELPREDRRALRAEIGAHGAGGLPREASAVPALIETLRASPFDAQAAAAQLAAQDRRQADWRAAMRTA